jgi:hypothetical protein
MKSHRAEFDIQALQISVTRLGLAMSSSSPTYLAADQQAWPQAVRLEGCLRLPYFAPYTPDDGAGVCAGL